MLRQLVPTPAWATSASTAAAAAAPPAALWRPPGAGDDDEDDEDEELVLPTSFGPIDPASTRAVDSDSARAALLHLVSHSCRRVGFDGAQSSVLHLLIESLEEFLHGMATISQDLAHAANRRVISAKDLLVACDAQPGFRAAELRCFLRERRKRGPSRGEGEGAAHADGSAKAQALLGLRVQPADGRVPPWAHVGEDWLDSEEDEGADKAVAHGSDVEGSDTKKRKPVVVPRKRRRLRMDPDICPEHLPNLPQFHTWRQTPVFPTSSVAGLAPLELLNFKLSSARLVESSLRRLIRATDQAALDAERKRPEGGATVGNDSRPTKIEGAAAPGVAASGNGDDRGPSPRSGTPNAAAAAEASTSQQNPEQQQRVRAPPKLSLRLRSVTSQTAKASGISEPQLVSAKVLGGRGSSAGGGEGYGEERDATGAPAQGWDWGGESGRAGNDFGVGGGMPWYGGAMARVESPVGTPTLGGVPRTPSLLVPASSRQGSLLVGGDGASRGMLTAARLPSFANDDAANGVAPGATAGVSVGQVGTSSAPAPRGSTSSSSMTLRVPPFAPAAAGGTGGGMAGTAWPATTPYSPGTPSGLYAHFPPTPSFAPPNATPSPALLLHRASGAGSTVAVAAGALPPTVHYRATSAAASYAHKAAGVVGGNGATAAASAAASKSGRKRWKVA